MGLPLPLPPRGKRPERPPPRLPRRPRRAIPPPTKPRPAWMEDDPMGWPPATRPPPPPPPVPGSPECVALMLRREEQRRNDALVRVVPLTRRERWALRWYRMKRLVARWAAG